jgi:hypothetical protein
MRVDGTPPASTAGGFSVLDTRRRLYGLLQRGFFEVG